MPMWRIEEYIATAKKMLWDNKVPPEQITELTAKVEALEHHLAGRNAGRIRSIEQVLQANGYTHVAEENGTHVVFDRHGGVAGYFRAHEVLPALNLQHNGDHHGT